MRKTTKYFEQMRNRADRKVQTMKMSYFDDTDTLYIEFSESDIAESRDLDENTVLDLNSSGQIVAITFEHASERTDINKLTISGLAA